MNIFLLSCSSHEPIIYRASGAATEKAAEIYQQNILCEYPLVTAWPGAEAVTVLTRCILNIPELTESEYGLFPAGLAHSGTWCKKSISSECAKKFCINFYIYSNQRLGIFSSYNGQLPGRHVVQAKRFPISDTMARVCHFLNFLHPV